MKVEDTTIPTHDFMPDEAALAALGELPDNEPVVMLNLLEYAEDGGRSYAKYGRIALPQIVKRGGKILYSGRPLLDDPTAGHWDRVIFVYYPTRAAFLEMMADPDYRGGLPHRAAGLKRTVLHAFTQGSDAPPLEAVPTQRGEEIFVLNLLRFIPDGGREAYQKYGAVVLPMIQERGGAPVLMLDAQLPLVSEEVWEDLYLVRTRRSVPCRRWWEPKPGRRPTRTACAGWISPGPSRHAPKGGRWEVLVRPPVPSRSTSRSRSGATTGA